MTLITTLLLAFASFFSSTVGFSAGSLDTGDLRKEENQAPFHEEEMGRGGQRGHCPHG